MYRIDRKRTLIQTGTTPAFGWFLPSVFTEEVWYAGDIEKLVKPYSIDGENRANSIIRMLRTAFSEMGEQGRNRYDPQHSKHIDVIHDGPIQLAQFMLLEGPAGPFAPGKNEETL